MGDIGEMKAIYEFTKMGFIVSKPLTDNARYDLLVEINKRVFKVQVKTTKEVKDGKMIFATKTTNYVQGNWKVNRYSTNDVDIFFLYCFDNDWCGLLIPEMEGFDLIPVNFYVRITPPLNNQKIGIHLAEEYSLESQLSKLLDYSANL